MNASGPIATGDHPQRPEHAKPDTGRNLLFAILALQNGFIDRIGLLAAFAFWVADRSRPLAEILVERGAIDNACRGLLEALVAEHVKQHGGDPEASLASVSSLGPVRNDLAMLADSELLASLEAVASARRFETQPDATADYAQPAAATGGGPRFRVLRPHARGGLGQVSLALDTELDRPVALKEIRALHADDPARRARFVQEAEITGKLEHPGIIPVYGLGHDASGRPFYAMRFIRGDNLNEAIARFRRSGESNTTPEERMAGLRALVRRFTDVCNAVAYAHSRGVLHRDLKPGNIMLGPYGETIVVDWGLAKVLGTTATTPDPSSQDDAAPTASPTTDGPIRLSCPSGSAVETIAGHPIGTPAYASPEQAGGRLHLFGPATDIYGLGAILYTILTGEAPVSGDDRDRVLARVERGDFRPPRAIDSSIPKPLEAICLKAMALEPGNRYATVRALQSDIERWLDDLPVSVYREPWNIRLRRWLRRHRTAAVGAISALAVATVGLGIAVVSSRRAEQAEQEQSQKLVDHILTRDLDGVTALVDTLGNRSGRVNALMSSLWRESTLDPMARLRVALALAATDHEARDELVRWVEEGRADARTVRIIAERLKEVDSKAAEARFWTLVENIRVPVHARFHAACALAILDPPARQAGESRWAQQIDWVLREALGPAPIPTNELDRTLSPLGGLYLRGLARHCRFGDPLQASALELLRAHWDRKVRPRSFVEEVRPAVIILEAERNDFEWLLKVLQEFRDESVADLARALDDPNALWRESDPTASESAGRRQARAAIALARLGATDRCWAALGRRDNAEFRAWFNRDVSRYGVDVTAVIERLPHEPDPRARATLILALGGYDPRLISGPARREIESLFAEWYRDAKDSGVHGAVAWVLGEKWGQRTRLQEIDRAVSWPDPVSSRDWFVNGQHQTFLVARGPCRIHNDQTGSRPQAAGDARDQKRAADEELTINRSFAIATTEVTLASYGKYFLETTKSPLRDHKDYFAKASPDANCPIHGANWYQALFYCRWLSEQECIPEDQMCFPSIAEMRKSLAGGKLPMKPGYLQLTGYRLPTEAEWEYACRAGTITPWFFGRSDSLLPEYARFAANSEGTNREVAETQGRTFPVGQLKPNEFGLFDVYGNVREWCLDADKPYELETIAGKVAGTISPTGDRRVLRGGSFLDSPPAASSGHRLLENATRQYASAGFRVARTVR